MIHEGVVESLALGTEGESDTVSNYDLINAATAIAAVSV